MPITHKSPLQRPVSTIGTIVMMAISILGLVPGSVSAESHCDATVSFGESIQAAIDVASPGDTICVGPGTYPGNLEIDTADLTLRSTDGATNTIIDPEGAFVAVRAMSGGLGNVTVDGFTVLEDWIAAGIGQGLAASEGTSLHVINNIVMAPATTSQHGNAIQVTGDGSTVHNNSVVVPHQVSPDWSGSGILLFGASNVWIQGNTATSSPEESCIVLGGDNFGAPAAHNNTIVDNIVHDCGFGIVIETGVHNTVITGNKILNNTIGVHPNEGVEDAIELRHNYFSGNEIGIKNPEGNPTVDARLNWWGCPDGPEDDACDPVEGDVLYDPWLTSPDYTGSMEFEHDDDVILEATMLDSNGDGVTGIEVEFFVDDASVGTAMTNEAGVATLHLGTMDAGVYEVRAEALCGCLVADASVTVTGPSDPEPECQVVGLQATANPDGSNTIHVVTNATFDLVRTSGSETVDLGTFTGDTQVVDSDTEVGTTYTYTVWIDGMECGSIEVTSIPVFPNAIAAGLAAFVGLLAYVGMRRLR